MAMRIAFTGSMSLFFALATTAAYAEPAQLSAHPVALVTTFGADARFDAAAHVEQGFNLIRKGKQAQAVQLFDKVIADADQRLGGDLRPRLCSGGGAGTVAIDSAVCDAHFGKGYALIDMGRGDLAEAELRQAAQMAPTNAHFANEYAELFKSRRDWQRSYDLFSKAWAVVDKSTSGADASVAARALRGMGFTKAQLGQYDEAQKLFTQSLSYEPNSAAAKAELGNIARRKAIGS